ncbi:chromosome segregation ATPase [Paracoccus halophilus]|uniref:Chromosome partitioning protein ParA n=1 Tax=Paracoccus halophilus TaxID=376733 RepID=A0A099F6H8_9RHOB|nr:AAA family ATPase [Paracoccus halophilus]KGJ05727.1 chromosome partitioning protein ParA [Paracoccus halophilus]SFA48110.1 chromosome segregation ATPase [Paracoccus halophilus]
MSETRIIAVANQKGGVGKTTTAINLGAALAEGGHRVAIIDLDPQGNASTGLGVPPEKRELTSYDLLAADRTLEETLQATAIENLWLVPSNSDLSSADFQLSSRSGRTHLLRRKLSESREFDYILIDCPPALGLLTVNAMVAADSVLVPLQAEFYALEGLSQLLMTVREVRQTANPDLRIDGVLLTMSDNRNNLSQQVEADARNTLAGLVYRTVIPRNVRLSEAPSHAMPVLQYDPLSKGSAAYRSLAEEFLSRQMAPA